MDGLIAPIFMGVLSAFALLITLNRVDLRKFMGYPICFDVSGTLLFAVLFHDSLTGMMIAVIATLTLWLFITMYRRYMGYKRFNLKARKWVYYPPRQCKND